MQGMALHSLSKVSRVGSSYQLWQKVCSSRYGSAHVCRGEFIAFLQVAALFSACSTCSVKLSVLVAIKVSVFPQLLKFVSCIFYDLIAKCFSRAVLYKREWQ
jgi:hypothetical protein